MRLDRFEFEELIVWQKLVLLADMVIGIVESLATDRKHYRIIDQLESSSTSVAMNMAEVKGRASQKAFILHLRYSTRSLYESLTIIEVFKRRSWITDKDYKALRAISMEIIKMIHSLISSLSINT